MLIAFHIFEFFLKKNLKVESAVQKFFLKKIFHTYHFHKRPNFNAVEQSELEFEHRKVYKG